MRHGREPAFVAYFPDQNSAMTQATRRARQTLIRCMVIPVRIGRTILWAVYDR